MKRKKTPCPAVKRREAKRRSMASIEFYDHDGDPQYYCMGWIDMATDELLETCRNCPGVEIVGEKSIRRAAEYIPEEVKYIE